MPATASDLLTFALSFPETSEDHPWSETVVKVRRKGFVFLSGSLMTVKLDESHRHALSVEGAEPTGYGWGRTGWVTVPFADLPLDLVHDWIEESYRIVAPKRLVAMLDAG
jgi:predicted DNA-binding protein (MmcQ/YjbR family)